MIVTNGIYEHYKTGRLYRAVYVAKHSETLEDLVVYESLYQNDLSRIWARPLKMFEEIVQHNGQSVRRFALKGQLNNEEVQGNTQPT
jgi:hypothetical protein